MLWKVKSRLAEITIFAMIHSILNVVARPMVSDSESALHHVQRRTRTTCIAIALHLLSRELGLFGAWQSQLLLQLTLPKILM